MKRLVIGVLLAIVGVLGWSYSASAGICPADAPNQSATSLAECYVVPPEGVSDDLLGTVQNIINIVIGLVAVVAVVVMIIGGISFITSQGDAPKITKARNTILYGVVGLIIAVLSFAIVTFVLKGVMKSGGTP